MVTHGRSQANLPSGPRAEWLPGNVALQALLEEQDRVRPGARGFRPAFGEAIPKGGDVVNEACQGCRQSQTSGDWIPPAKPSPNLGHGIPPLEFGPWLAGRYSSVGCAIRKAGDGARSRTASGPQEGIPAAPPRATKFGLGRLEWKSVLIRE